MNTIVGNEVNLAARLETAAEPGSILLAHETNALVRDIVLTEEQPAIQVKGFARPIENFKVVGTYDELIDEGRVIHRDSDGVTITVDRDRLDQAGKESAIQELEDVIAQLKK